MVAAAALPFHFTYDSPAVGVVPLELAFCIRVLGLQQVFTWVTRGESTLIPHREGRDPNPVLVDEAVFDLDGWIYPTMSPDGDVYADPLVGALTNIEYWSTALQPTSGSVTRLGTIVRPAPLDDLAGQVQITEFRVGGTSEGQSVPFTMGLRLPAGLWAPVSS